MRILCLGAGAIGGYFGGRLVEAGYDITFLVRPERQARMQGRLRIESCYGDVELPVKTATRETAEGPYDYVLLTCKAYDLDNAIESISAFVGIPTAILPLLNGVAHIDILNRKFSKERVLGGVAKIASTVAADGTIKHLNEWRFVTFGEQSGEMTVRVAELKTAFDATTVIAETVPNVMHIMWEKMVHLATVAGGTCLMRASVGEIARTDLGRDFMIEFLEKNAEISKCEGYEVSASFLDEYRQLFADTTSTYAASMLRDMLRGGPIEADHIIGFMLRKAEQYKLDARDHRLILTNLQAYEQHRSASVSVKG